MAGVGGDGDDEGPASRRDFLGAGRGWDRQCKEENNQDDPAVASTHLHPPELVRSMKPTSRNRSITTWTGRATTGPSPKLPPGARKRRGGVEGHRGALDEENRSGCRRTLGHEVSANIPLAAEFLGTRSGRSVARLRGR